MAKDTRKEYFWLTLYQPDIKEIMRIFRENLQNVDITIDALSITDSQQIEHFDQTYRVKSLVARGYYEEVGQDVSGERVLQPIMLKIGERSARLSFSAASGQNVQYISKDLDMLLRKRQNQFCNFVVSNAHIVTMGAPWVVISLSQNHRINFVLELFLIIVVLLFLPVFIFLFIGIEHLLKLDKTVFLFPGRMNASKRYGVLQAIGIFITAIIFLIVIGSILFIVFRMLKLL